MGLLTRAIFIIDNQGKVKYKELVANISAHPDYASALTAVKNIAPVIVVKPTTVEPAVVEPSAENKASANDSSKK